MPLFYNTSPPTPNSKNTINSISIDYGIRDFLLHKNLLPVYPNALNNSPGLVKIGEPVLDTMVGNGTVTQPIGLPLETEGILRMNIAIAPNKYKDKSSNAGTLVNVETGPLSNPYGLPLETEGILRMEVAILENRFRDASSTFGDLTIIENVPKTVGDFPNSTFINGIGGYPTGPNEDVTKYGIMGKTIDAKYRKNATIKNLYLDVDKQVDIGDWLVLEPIPTTQQVKGYLDVYGNLNIGNSNGINTANIIGSILNGQGLGLSKGGVIPNFDLRASLIGRVLGSTGVINDTKLGLIGGQQLALALANNAAFNVQQSVLGTLNVQDNILSLVKNGTLAGFRPNYQITVHSGIGGKIMDYTSRILGFTLPKSYLDDAGSIFLNESNSANIERANSMILNTGKGQVQAMIANMFANLNGTTQNDSPDTTTFRTGYAPGYKDNTGKAAINPSLYAFYNSDKSTIYNFLTNKKTIPEINYNRSSMISEYGFTGPEESLGDVNPYSESTIKKATFSWSSTVGGNVNSETSKSGGNELQPFLAADKKKSLLAKTQLLFNDIGMKNIVSGFGDINPTIKASQIQTAVVGGGISKGSAVISGNKFNANGRYTGKLDSPANTYCRSWTTKSRYENVSNLVRHSGLNRFQTTNSVLDEYGFPKIAPYSSDNIDDPKKFMFSIENLAWCDNIQDLLPCEVGSGDLMSNKKGRIMWFPPYNIHFEENTSVNWDSTNFVGRGESVYTYNNTERSGTLSFSVVVDHPSYVNSFTGPFGPDDHYIASFFAGCVDKLTVSELSSIASENITKPQEKNVTAQLPPSDIVIYFPNDVASLPSTYENGLSGSTTADTIDYSVYVSGYGLGSYLGEFTSPSTWNDNYNFGLNGQKNVVNIDDASYNGFLDPLLISSINDYLNTKCPACVVEVAGYASAQGNSQINQKLANARRDNTITTLKTQLHTNFNGIDKDKRFKAMPSKELTGTGCIALKGADTDTLACKQDRKVVIHFRFDESLLPTNEISAEPTTPTRAKSVNTKILNRYYDECSYFEQLTDKDSFVFDKFREKIKYFHPAFHSTTPEGLNSRLTFLNQCTRQGPTLEEQGANNLAFGRAPICILRIGDFYNTKIVIDNIGISYDPIVWDLNPEGVGVQPMIANINMTFKFIGGSTLMGPINKLQNALSFNYYANAQVYDPRADYIAKTVDLAAALKGNDKGLKNTLSLDGKYAIVNGVVDMNSLSEKIQTQTAIDDKTPIIDQLAANDFVNGPTAPQKSDIPIDDKSIINQIVLTDYYKIDGNSLKLSFSYNDSIGAQLNLDSTLNKLYKGQLYLMSTIDNTIKTNVGFVSIISNGLNNGVKFNDVELSPTHKAWQINLTLTDDQVTAYNNGLNAKGSIISLEWETGSKNILIFTLNSAL